MPSNPVAPFDIIASEIGRDRATSLLTALEASGYAVVPVVPTRQMGLAGADSPHAKHYVELAGKEGEALVGEPCTAPLHGAALACDIWSAMLNAYKHAAEDAPTLQSR